MIATPSLHARRRTHHAFDEEMVMTHADENSPKRKRKQTVVLRAGYAAVGIYVVLGLFCGYLLLHHQHRKVVVHVIRNPWAHGRAALRMATTMRHSGFHHHFYSGQPRFVTVVLPSVVNPGRRPQRLESIHDTWGPLARAIYVIHDMQEFAKAAHLTLSEEQHPTDRYSYPQNLLLPSTIGVEEGLPRLYYTIQAIYERVNPDFAFFVNDHTYVIPSHLCHFLEGKSAEADLYAGHALHNGQAMFNSGAAGYILSRSTMKKLVDQFAAKDPNCWIDADSATPNKKWLQGNPGLVIADCLRHMGVRVYDTRSQHKYHRFHAFPLVRMVTGEVDAWYINKHRMDEEVPKDLLKGFDASYATLLKGTDCCSRDSVSFHYVESKEGKALYLVQQALLDQPKMPDSELISLMEQYWPSEQADVGGYSRRLPKKSKTEDWSNLVKVIRHISTKDTQRDC
jgi:hypothetical protein